MTLTKEIADKLIPFPAINELSGRNYVVSIIFSYYL